MSFDSDEAKKYLLQKENQAKEAREEVRKKILHKTIHVLKEKFANTSVEVYVVGSLIRPYAFTERSDVDIVVKNYQGDRFTLWGELENQIGRTVEIILFEACPFQEFVLKEGHKVI